MAATPKQPADGDQASHAGLPTYDHDHDQDQDHDQDRFLVDVRYDLCDAFANLGSSVAHKRAEGHEALRRTLRIWLKHRADDTHFDPEFLVHRLQSGDSKEDLASREFDEQDRVIFSCLKGMSADLGLKVLVVVWTLTDFVHLKRNFKDHCEVVRNVSRLPTGASKEWHTRHGLLSSRIDVKKLIELDGRRLDLRHKYLPITNTSNLARHLIQKDGHIFYDNHFLKWESDLVSDLPSRHSPGHDTDRGSSPSDAKRPTATQCYQGCVSPVFPLLLFAV